MTEVARRVLALGGLRALVMAALTAPSVVGLSLLVIQRVGADRAPEVLVTISVLGSAVAMVANPLCGWGADRWPGRGGSRRWWLIVGAAVGLAGSLMVATATEAWALAAGWMIAQAGYNGCFGALNALVSTLLSARWHQRAAGIFSASAYLGTLPGLAIAALAADRLAIMILTLPVVALVVIVIAAPFLPSPLKPSTSPPATQVSGEAGPARASAVWARLLSPGVRRALRGPFVTVVALRVVIAAELSAGLTFAVYMALDRWSMTGAEAAGFAVTMSVVGSAGIVVASLLLALPWSRRLSERTWLVVALVGIAASSVGRGFAFEVPVFLVVTFIAGLAIGLGVTATRSAAHAALPPDESGLGLGLLNVGNTLGPIVGPVLAGNALGLGLFAGFGDDYVGMFVVLALPALLAIPLVRWVRGGGQEAGDGEAGASAGSRQEAPDPRGPAL